MGSFAIIIFPLIIFWYLLLTNTSSLERKSSKKVLARIYDSIGIGRYPKNILLISASLLIALSLARPALIERYEEPPIAKKRYVLMLKNSPEEIAQTSKAIAKLKGEIALVIVAGGAYLLSPPTKDKDFLQKRVSMIDEFDLTTSIEHYNPKELANMGEIIEISLFDVDALGTESDPLIYKNISELYSYFLIAGAVLFFLSLFNTLRIKPFFMRIAPLFLSIFLYADDCKEYEKKSKNGVNVAFYNVANCYYKKEEYEKALENYLRFVPKSKKEEFYKLYNIGNTLFMSDELERAEIFYKRALNIDAKDDDLLYNLNLLRQKRDTEATSAKAVPTSSHKEEREGLKKRYIPMIQRSQNGDKSGAK